MSKELTITLTKEQLAKLQGLYVEVLVKWRPDGALEALLYDHAMDMEKTLRVKMAKEVNKPQLKLTRSEARAFWLLWQMIEVTSDGEDDTEHEYLNNIIAEATAAADKYLT